MLNSLCYPTQVHKNIKKADWEDIIKKRVCLGGVNFSWYINDVTFIKYDAHFHVKRESFLLLKRKDIQGLH